MTQLPTGAKSRIVYADPPWPMYGDPNKNAAAGKHYPLMSFEQLVALDVRRVMQPPAALFLWSTCPRLDLALDLIRAWNLHFRGVAYIWIKTRRDGRVMGARGIPPTFVKPVSEIVLVATTNKTGRPFPIHSFSQSQIVMAPVGKHSEKPGEVRRRIDQLCGDVPRIELFAREKAPGWDAWGLEAGRRPWQFTLL